MRWVLVLVVSASAPALAKDADLSKTCPPVSTWDTMWRCLETRGSVHVVHDLPDAKLVAYTLTATTRFELYVRDGSWKQLRSGWTTNTKSELLNFGTYPDGYRVDIGTAFETIVRIDPALDFVPVVVKRINTSLCSRKGVCRTVTTSCDMLVRGRSHGRFRGTPVWKGERLLVRGDASNTGTHCRISKFQLAPEDDEGGGS